MFISSGTGCWMISLKKFLTQLDLALPQRAIIGPRRIPPELPLFSDGRGNEFLTVLILVDHRNSATKETLHLILEPPPVASCAAAAGLHAQFTHELGE